MRSLWLLVLLVPAIAWSYANENTTPDSLAGRCLQLQVAVEDGFRVDGEPTPDSEVGNVLAQKLKTQDRTAIVDVRCEQGVTVAALVRLHAAMREQGLYRIQYLRNSGAAVPYMLPSPEIEERLAGLTPEQQCLIALDAGGQMEVDGAPIVRPDLRGDVRRILADHPDIVMILQMAPGAAYADFVDALGDLTAGGAQRIAIRIG
jgi:biopolymer transport protein ExbD